MTEWLLLRVAREPEGPWSWAVVDAAGQLLVAPGESTGAPLQAAATGRRVALLLPGADVALLSATLPAGNEAKLLPLVPFALEDQVSQDIELLHFALGQRDAVDRHHHGCGGRTRTAGAMAGPGPRRWDSPRRRHSRRANWCRPFPARSPWCVSDDQLVLRSDGAQDGGAARGRSVAGAGDVPGRRSHGSVAQCIWPSIPVPRTGRSIRGRSRRCAIACSH